MGRPVITSLLHQAEQMLAASDRQVISQRRIVEKLRAMGADTWGAQSLLNDCLEIRRLHARERDRFRSLLNNGRSGGMARRPSLAMRQLEAAMRQLEASDGESTRVAQTPGTDSH